MKVPAARWMPLLAPAVVVGILSNLPTADTPMAGPPRPRVEVDGARFKLRFEDGRVIAGQTLRGAVFALDGPARNVEIRIDRVEAGPSPDVELYQLSQRYGPHGRWSEVCRSGPDGRARGFPLPARDASKTGEFTIACTAGALAKCVMRGYRPWASTPEGNSLAPYFQACVHMLRADYCGDGRSHTRDGIRIESWDRLGIRARSTDLPFEAAWGASGAVCLARTRVPAVSQIGSVVARCPRVAVGCDQPSTEQNPDVLLWNASPARD